MGAYEKLAYFRPARAGVPYKNIPARAYDPESGVFLLQSDSKETRVGICYESNLLNGADDRTVSSLQSALTTRMPDDTFIQFGLLSEPDISDDVAAYLSRKLDSTGVLREMTFNRARMFNDAVNRPLPALNGVLMNRQRLFVTITIPCDYKEVAINAAKEKLVDLATKIKQGLSSAGLFLEVVDEAHYLCLMRKFFYMYELENKHVDDFKDIREQVCAPSTEMYFDKDEILIDGGNLYAKIMSVKNFPEATSIAAMNLLIGDPYGTDKQVTDPYWLAATIYYPNQDAKLSAVRAKYGWLTKQAMGPMTQLIPTIGYKKRGFDTLIHEIDGSGSIVCELNFTMMLFSKDRERLNGLASSWKGWAASNHFDMREDSRILEPLFYQLLPFGQTTNGIKNLERFSTMCVSHVVHQLPIIGSWHGSGNGGLSILNGRRGQAMLFDMYDSQTNYNGLIAAEPGGGKSVVAQQMICDMLASGGRAWAIDQGRSYEKLCHVLGKDRAQFIEFSEESNICLNPFTFVTDIKEDMDMLKAVFTKMASPTTGLDSFQLSALESKIIAAFSVSAQDTTVTMVAEQCLNDKDQRINDIGTQLFAFTARGSFGRWFNGKNNVDLTKDFVVMELQELQSKPVLQQVVLLLLFASINNEMYLTHGRRKLLLIDEAWNLLDDPVMAKAIEAAYRKVRKHEGSAWLVTQSVGDLYNSPNGRAIIGCCAWQVILQQKTDSIDFAIKSGHLNLDGFAAQMMKSVHTVPGLYSEIMIRNGNSFGIGRLILDRFSQVLFSTKGWERDEVLERIWKGEDSTDVINQLIAERG